MGISPAQRSQVAKTVREPAKVVAKRLGLTPKQVYETRYHLGLRSTATREERARIVAELVASRETATAAARRLGLPRQTVANWMDDAGYHRGWVRKA